MKSKIRNWLLNFLGFDSPKYVLGMDHGIKDPSCLVVLAQYPNGHLEVAYMKQYDNVTQSDLDRLANQLIQKYRIKSNNVYKDTPFGRYSKW